MKAVIVIPARYASVRLPGKLILPEVKIATGRYIIEHVYQNVRGAKLASQVIVATDSECIREVVKGFGGEVEMTSPFHISGTSRIAEIAEKLDADIIVNVQGDEPEVTPSMVDQVILALKEDHGTVMATLACPIREKTALYDPNVVKVVLDNWGYALYFSRSQIPFVRDSKCHEDTGTLFLRHLGIYAYCREFLLTYVKLPPSPLEHAEKLEQLRALSNGYRIKVSITQFTGISIDTKEDLTAFIERYRI